MGGNDNWYELIPTSIFSGIDYNSARSAALASTHMGMNGYLATITSAAEQTFIEQFGIPIGFGGSGSVWLGATTLATPGTYRWADGPEAGQALTYTNWFPGHPVPGWEYMALHRNVISGVVNGWISLTVGDGTFGYIVEYGDGILDLQPPPPGAQVPEPSTYALIGVGLLGAALRLRRSY
jgi:hypothetical protein